MQKKNKIKIYLEYKSMCALYERVLNVSTKFITNR